MKGWRTILVNLAVAVFGVLEATDWTGLMGSEAAGWMVVALAMANVALRALTTTPIGQIG